MGRSAIFLINKDLDRALGDWLDSCSSTVADDSCGRAVFVTGLTLSEERLDDTSVYFEFQILTEAERGKGICCFMQVRVRGGRRGRGGQLLCCKIWARR